MGGGGVKKHRRINKTLGGEKAQKLDSCERSRVREGDKTKEKTRSSIAATKVL